MKRLLLVFGFLIIGFLPLSAQQSTITVMQYNLLQYGNYASGYADCYETNNNTQQKDEAIRTILGEVRPDILTVCEFGKPQSLQTDFLKHNLNINGAVYWKSDNIINYANSSIINHIFYDSRKMELKSHVALRTDPRDTDVYELYMKTPGLLAGDTIKLVCIVTHPKAGMGYEAERRTTMQKAMDYVSQHYAHDNVLIMGDFNMYRSSETGYQLLTKTYSNPDVLFVDPVANLGGVGSWNNNSQFARFHTQSTRRYSDECFSSGGLDDRFDFILMSDEIYMGFNRIKYVNNSYYAVGNDGNHFDQSIDQNGNSAVSPLVAEALFNCSDHLPVTLQMTVYSQLDVEENEAAGFEVYPNPTDGTLFVKTWYDTDDLSTYRIINLMGQTLMTGEVTQTIDVAGLPTGIYVIQVNGMTRKFVKR
jgi:endonuclease/exonuclease/phosphatase family metal-dependent hydrolase